MGVSFFVSVGNETDIPIPEYLRYAREDPSTKVIALYMEDVKDGRRFLEEASLTTRTKPIVLLKTGMTETGARATASHTGALAGSAVVSRAAFRRAGIITALAAVALLAFKVNLFAVLAAAAAIGVVLAQLG